MYKYLRLIVVMISICSMQISFCEDVVYTVPQLDAAQCDLQQQDFNKKYTRHKYVKYATPAAIIAAAYIGYNLTAAPAAAISTSQSLFPQFTSLLKLQSEHEALRQQVNILSGQSMLSWGSNLLNQAVGGLSLYKVFTLGSAMLLGNALDAYVDRDEFWYEFRSDADFTRGIITQARRLANPSVLNPVTDEEKESLRRVMYDTTVLIKQQVERVVGFVRHKQEKYVTEYPAIAAQVDDQIHCLKVSYEEFSKELVALLNEKGRTLQDISASIIASAERFSGEYNQVKDHFKALENVLKIKA